MSLSVTNPDERNEERAQKLLSARKVLFVGAHPDDIEFYCGGLVRLLRRAGAEATFAVATRGGRGKRGRLKALIENLRTNHQLEAASILGGARVIFFNYQDGSLSAHVDALSADLLKLIEVEQPDLVLGWDPDHIYNPHPDHVAAAQATRAAAAGLQSGLCCYGTTHANTWIALNDESFHLKLRALRAHKTETPWPYSVLMKHRLRARSIGEGARIGSPHAEVLRVVE